MPETCTAINARAERVVSIVLDDYGVSRESFGSRYSRGYVPMLRSVIAYILRTYAGMTYDQIAEHAGLGSKSSAHEAFERYCQFEECPNEKYSKIVWLMSASDEEIVEEWERLK